MSRGIDVGTSQRNLNFDLAKASGYTSCYVKLGGDNVPRYVAPYYGFQVGRCRDVGMRVGHYWVPNGALDPIGAADFYVNNLRGWTSADFAVLDNETLDRGRLFTDSQAAAWVNRVRSRLNIPARQVKVYLGLSDARSHNWTHTLGTGCDFIIAAYSYSPWGWAAFPTIPISRIKGHQYSSTGVIGGTIIDLNDWKADAFSYGTTTAGTGTPVPTTTDHPQKVGEPLVFIAVREGSFFLIVPHGQRNVAIALGRQDVTTGLPRVDFNWDNSWAALKATFANAPFPAPVVNVPAPIVNVEAPASVPVGEVSVSLDPAAVQAIVDAINALPENLNEATRAAFLKALGS